MKHKIKLYIQYLFNRKKYVADLRRFDLQDFGSNNNNSR